MAAAEAAKADGLASSRGQLGRMQLQRKRASWLIVPTGTVAPLQSSESHKGLPAQSPSYFIEHKRRPVCARASSGGRKLAPAGAWRPVAAARMASTWSQQIAP